MARLFQSDSRMENFFRTHAGRLSLILGGIDLALLGAASLVEGGVIPSTSLHLRSLPGNR